MYATFSSLWKKSLQHWSTLLSKCEVSKLYISDKGLQTFLFGQCVLLTFVTEGRDLFNCKTTKPISLVRA